MEDTQESGSSGIASQQSEGSKRVRHTTPLCLVLGMAGSGKTTLVDQLSLYLDENDEEQLEESVEEKVNKLSINDDNDDSDDDDEPGAYVINLDPAVYEVPYEPNIDIRDTVKYKQVMEEYSLGPNGAIITSLNLYATRFDQVLNLLEKRAPEHKCVLVDTPGQIETFTWSASGTIITESLAMTHPTVTLFVVDTKRSESSMTFVSNMLYACSIMYKTRLPMIIVFNKIDVVSCKYAEAWLRDFDAFDAALKEDQYIGTLARSMAMALEEFYRTMRCVGVSAYTGEGMDELLRNVKDAADEYEREYRPIVEQRMQMKEEEEKMRIQGNMDRFKHDRKLANEEDGDIDGPDMGESSTGDKVQDARIAKLKGEWYDEDEENRLYEKFMTDYRKKQNEAKHSAKDGEGS